MRASSASSEPASNSTLQHYFDSQPSFDGNARKRRQCEMQLNTNMCSRFNLYTVFRNRKRSSNYVSPFSKVSRSSKATVSIILWFQRSHPHRDLKRERQLRRTAHLQKAEVRSTRASDAFRECRRAMFFSNCSSVFYSVFHFWTLSCHLISYLYRL